MKMMKVLNSDTLDKSLRVNMKDLVFALISSEFIEEVFREHIFYIHYHNTLHMNLTVLWDAENYSVATRCLPG